jgi:predicted small lipoprotein YifL
MRPAALLTIAAATLLSACGVKGALERPPPLMGDARDAFEAEEAKAAEARAAKERQRIEIPVGQSPAPAAPAPLEAPGAPNLPPNPFQTGPNPR